MKKIIFTAAAAFAFAFSNAQDAGFKAGIHLGMPIGTSGDSYSFNGGVDAAYMWSVADKFQAGLTTGYSYYAGKEVSTPSITIGAITIPGTSVKVNGAFIPVAATGQYSFSDKIFGGLDLGYAIYAGDGSGDGGFYYQPKVGYQTEKYEIYASYKGISVDGGSISSVGLGFNYKF